MKTAAKTPTQYVASLPPDRQSTIETVRKVILDNLPKGYEEAVIGGMLMYVVPFSRLAKTYNGHPLCYVALASQKNYMSVYLMSVYGHKELEKWFRAEFKARGKTLDMGKSCVRFKSVDDLPLDVIGETVAKVPLEKWVSLYEQSRKVPRTERPKAASGGTRGRAKKGS